MARVTHVKKAQQRYKTVPVLGDDGQPVKIALTRKDGQPKMTRAKAGREPRQVFITKTVADKTKPLPLLSCDFPGCKVNGGKIAVGSPYKWVKPKSGPYGGHQRNRHAEHPTWQQWDLSNSMSAQLARISHDFGEAIAGAEDTSEAEAARDEAASGIRDIGEQKRESASNIEEGFGHPTSQSEELEQMADELVGWADEVEGTDVPALEDHDCDHCDGGKAECADCGGTGHDGEDATTDCGECGGSGEQECVECDGSGTDLEGWREAVQEALSIVDESPV